MEILLKYTAQKFINAIVCMIAQNIGIYCISPIPK